MRQTGPEALETRGATHEPTTSVAGTVVPMSYGPLSSSDVHDRRRPHPTRLPHPRGPVSSTLVALLAGPPTSDPDLAAGVVLGDVWAPHDEDTPWWAAPNDIAVALVHLDELHRRGLIGVDEGWEGHPLLAAARWALAAPIRRGTDLLTEPTSASGCAVVRSILAMAGAPYSELPWSRLHEADRLNDAVVITALQRLRERDVAATLLPQLAGRPRAVLARVIAGDGSGSTGRRETVGAVLRARGLRDRTGRYLDALPGTALWRLAVPSQLVTRRPTRGATLGWLAASDALAAAGRTVTGEALRAHGIDRASAERWDSRVVGHEGWPTFEAVERLVDQEPRQAAGVLAGARSAVRATTAVESELDLLWRSGERALGRHEPSDDDTMNGAAR